ncbi:MAG TPA: glycogen synthase, partial [Planctomycetes bacterium]|nr:glycogen synthase [Planctomycetota bacterium]
MRVLHVAAEVAPFIKSGGLADVAQALPAALRRLGHDARVCLPCYRRSYVEADSRKAKWLTTPMIIESGGIDHRVGIAEVNLDGMPVYLLACNELY